MRRLLGENDRRFYSPLNNFIFFALPSDSDAFASASERRTCKDRPGASHTSHMHVHLVLIRIAYFHGSASVTLPMARNRPTLPRQTFIEIR